MAYCINVAILTNQHPGPELLFKVIYTLWIWYYWILQAILTLAKTRIHEQVWKNM